MSITKEYIKTLSREMRLMLIMWAAESLQEEESELIFTDELKAHIDAIDTRYKEGKTKIYSKEDIRRRMDELIQS